MESKNPDNNPAATDANAGSEPVALLLARFNQVSLRKRRKIAKEIREAYDDTEIYMGHNKFLYKLAGKPIIQYVLDAVYNARKDGERLYRKIYVYNDIESLKERVPTENYPNLIIRQMKNSVGGHWREFYQKFLDYGQRVDVFFGDTPRITPEDVEFVHHEYGKILGKVKNHRGVPITMIFGVVDYEDMKDNWLPKRFKRIKFGKNKGKLKAFVGFEDHDTRVGNSGALLKSKCLDELLECKALNFFYNLRKALTPTSFSKILYHLWKRKKLNLVKQVKRKCINERALIDATFEILSDLYKIDLTMVAGILFPIRKNGSHWENDIDGPQDFKAIQDKMLKAGGGISDLP